MQDLASIAVSFLSSDAYPLFAPVKSTIYVTGFLLNSFFH